jgi:hypothetical protein
MVFGHVRPSSEENVASFSNGFVLPSRNDESLVPDYNRVESRECRCMVIESIHHIGCDLLVRMQKSRQLFQLQHVDLTKNVS